jgi:hypothetical protein
MALDTAQLSSLSTALDDLSKRVTELADQLHGSSREDAAGELYEVERHLTAAARRLKSVLDRA